MRTKITKDNISGKTAYIAQFKKHWWNKWKYVNNIKTKNPQLFSTYISARLMADIGKDFDSELYLKD